MLVVFITMYALEKLHCTFKYNTVLLNVFNRSQICHQFYKISLVREKYKHV
jgi:hypothetical protein